MNIEFHYHITYLLSLKAGFNQEFAYKIAYSSQFVDDNNKLLEVVDSGMNLVYCSLPTALGSIFPSTKRDIILQSFHFLPGNNPNKPMVTTANSKLANDLLDYALSKSDPYLIGISSHAFADTWAHQNFSGANSDINSLNNPFIPNIGHADAQDEPDILDAPWHDIRLDGNKMVKNSERFLDAARHLYESFYKASHGVSAKDDDLLVSLEKIFNNNRARFRFGRNLMFKRRSRMYDELAIQISGFNIPKYKADKWIIDALYSESRGHLWSKKYRWHKPDEFTSTDWWQFQEAAKTFQQQVLPTISSCRYENEIKN
jgi:hypothetical protein